MTEQAKTPPLALLSPKETASRVSLSWRSVQRKVSEGTFPQPVQISAHRIGFVENEVNDWIAELMSARA